MGNSKSLYPYEEKKKANDPIYIHPPLFDNQLLTEYLKSKSDDISYIEQMIYSLSSQEDNNLIELLKTDNFFINHCKKKYMNNPYVIYLTGLQWQYGNNINNEHAYQCYLESNNLGCVLAMDKLGYLCEQKFPSEIEKAINWYTKSINLKYVPSMYNLAKLYNNKGIFEMAEYWYKQAIDNNHIPSMYQLAKMYCYHSIHNDKAKELWEQAAKLGNTESMYALGTLYQNEYKNSESALYWFNKAVGGGDNMSMVDIGHIYQINGKYENALSSYLNFILLTYTSQSKPEIQRLRSFVAYNIGYLYEKSTERGINLIKACEWYAVAYHWFINDLDKDSCYHAVARLMPQINTTKCISYFYESKQKQLNNGIYNEEKFIKEDWS